MGPLARTDQPDALSAPSGDPIMLRSAAPPAAAALAVAGPAEDLKFTPLGFLTALKRRAWAAVRWGLLLAVPVAVAIWFLLPPPKPRVSATMYTNYDSNGIIFGHPDGAISQSTQMALIRSQLVLNAALRREYDPVSHAKIGDLDLVRQQGADAVDWLAKNIAIDYPYGREITRLSMTASAAEVEQAKLVLDAVVGSYLEEIINRSAKDRRDKKDKLEKLQFNSHENLKRKQQVIRKLADSVGSTLPDNIARQQSMILEQLHAAQKDWMTNAREVRRMEVEEAALKANGGMAGAPNELDVARFVESDPMVKEILYRRAVMEAKLKEIEAKGVNPKALPDHIQTTADLAASVKELDTARKKAREDFLAARKVQAGLEGQAKLAALREQIAFQKELGRVLQSDIDKFDKLSLKVTNANLDLEAEQVDAQQARDLYTKVTGALTTMNAEADAPPRVQPLERATVERVDLTARKIQFAIGGAIGSLGLAALVVGLLEFRHRRVESADLASRATDLAVVGTVPHVPGKIGRSPAAKRAYWQSVLTESMASTQTFLQHGDGPDAPRVLLVTSAEGGEGKTSVATQLAANFARSGLRTILIDGDLRQPAAHDCFGVASGPGLADILRGELDAAAVTLEVQPNLHFIPAGDADEPALVALAKQPGAALLDALRAEYEMVIIDSSPILPVADTLHLARRADGVLVAVLKGRSRLPMVKETARRLKRVKARVLGLVVSGVPHDGYGYGYSYHKSSARADTGRAAGV